MEVIETQFRAGNISFLDAKEEPENQRTKTAPSPRPEHKPRHSRKESVLIKNFKKHSRHRTLQNITD